MKILSMIVLLIFWVVGTNLLFFENECGKKQSNIASSNNQNYQKEETLPSLQTNNQNNQKEETNSTSQTQVKWIPATYQGLKLGESTIKDVKKLFGKPRWEGDWEEEGEPSRNVGEPEILLQFSDIGPEKQAHDVVVGKKSKVVKAIWFLPNPEMTREEAVSKYGSDYFEIGTFDSLCIKDDMSRGPSSKKLTYPILLIYPEKGMVISIGDDNKVKEVRFLYKCES